MLEDYVKSKAEAYLEDNLPAVFITGLKVSQRKIEILLDGDSGVTINQCGELSRHLSAWLDEEHESESPYTLEISSHGVGNPIQHLRQYKSNINRKARVILKSGEEMNGVLILVSKEEIGLGTGERDIEFIKFKEIQETKITV